MADRVIDLIYLKYLKAAISYHKDTIVETYPCARDAVREAVFNALIHCNWADNVPIQIRVEDDVMFVSNCSMLPFGWTAETLLSSHTSKPYNPDIARVFYRAGYIESWGRGIQKMCDACQKLGTEKPEYIVHGEDIMVKFMALQNVKVSVAKNPKPQDDALNDALEKKLVMLLKNDPYLTQKEMFEQLSVSRATIQRLVKKLVDKKIMERKGGKRYGHWEIHE